MNQRMATLDRQMAAMNAQQSLDQPGPAHPAPAPPPVQPPENLPTERRWHPGDNRTPYTWAEFWAEAEKQLYKKNQYTDTDKIRARASKWWNSATPEYDGTTPHK